MADHLRLYEVWDPDVTDAPVIVRAESGGKARWSVARSMAEAGWYDGRESTCLLKLRVRSLSPRRAPGRTSLPAHEHGLLRHAVGYRNASEKPGWRRHFLAPVGTEVEAAWERLVSAGLAERGREVAGGRYYHATDEGVREAEKRPPEKG